MTRRRVSATLARNRLTSWATRLGRIATGRTAIGTSPRGRRRRVSSGSRPASAPSCAGPGNHARWPEVAADLNRRLRGWGTYFSYGTRVLAYRAIDHYVADAVQHFLRRR